jgi:arylsulfatase A-like enzyme
MNRVPNILWIVTTQWRAQACGYAGDPNARTPHLDALAAQSTNYTQAVTPHPFGPFARAAMLTGVPSPQNGVCDYFDPLPAGARTIAHELHDRGYTTAYFGKWHLAPRDSQAPLVGEAHARMVVPAERRGGFDRWEGFESGFLLNDPWLHGTRLAQPVQMRGYQSDVVCGRAAQWMADQPAPQSQAAAPWFCVVSLEPPHPPYDAPAGGVPAGDPAAIQLPANVPRSGEAEERARRELAGYYAHIEATDRAIGERLLSAVGADTIVVFTSVHGDMHGAHGLFRKGWPHEESVRVPLLVRRPLVRPNAEFEKRSLDLVSLIDLPRWTMAWADGAERQTPHAKLGRALQQISMPSVVALPHQCDRIWRGARTASWKTVLNADGTPWLCFDLQADPGEMRNLVGAERNSPRVAAWRAETEAAWR